MKQLEEKIDTNHNILLAAIKNSRVGENQQQNESLNVRSNAASALSLIGYHRIVFAQQLTELPFNSVEKLVALNTALKDNNFAVTVVSILLIF